MSQLEPKKPAVIVGVATDPLRACLERMAKAGVGALMVIDATGRLEAIFTERDLARLWAELDKPAFLDTPVGTLATRPVFSMTLADLSQAPREMVARRIRHIPIVDVDQKVVGIVSMRDVLGAQLHAHPQRPPAPDTSHLPRCTLHMLTPTGQLGDLAKRYAPGNWDQRAWFTVDSVLKLPELQTPPSLKHTAFLLDLDGSSDGQWRELVKRFIKLLGTAEQPAIFIVSSPNVFAEKDRASLRNVAERAKWFFYQRPLPVVTLAHDLRELNATLGVTPA